MKLNMKVFACWMMAATLAPDTIQAFSATLSPPTGRADANARAPVKNVAVPGLEKGMDYVKLGDSDLVVSKVCMGTMTFGEQNTLDEGVEQLQKAWDTYGINFLDTAEMYPVPTKAETQGETDKIVAKFLKTQSKREDVILATKVCGRAQHISWLPRSQPDITPDLSRRQILDSVDASLERLETDYIDLLQLHWPDRYIGGFFGSPDFSPSSYEKAPTPIEFEETLQALQELIQAGKVRYVGVSNDTPYGVCTMAQLASQFPDLYPKIVSIQNSYSLVMRKDFEAGLAEACYHHNVGLLPYSPLAGGSLSGKYRDPENIPENARLKQFPGFMDRYLDSLNEQAVNKYCDLAAAHDLTPTELALSWCYHNEKVASTIIGATSMKQLDENIKAYDIRLSDEVHEEISKIYKEFTDPTKARN
jgi:aryl-alcohol dehydrogenase-like predicted oxidoreductase